MLTVGSDGSGVVVACVAVLVEVAVVQRCPGLVPDAEVPGRGRGAGRWLLGVLEGCLVVHLAGRAAEDVGDHESRPLGHGGRGRVVVVVVVVVVVPSLQPPVVVIVVPGVEPVRQPFHAHPVPLHHVLQRPVGLEAGHPGQVEAVVAARHGDAATCRHVVVLVVVDGHHGHARRWFLRATGTRGCLCRHPRTRPIPGRQNLADGRSLARAKLSVTSIRYFFPTCVCASLHFTSPPPSNDTFFLRVSSSVRPSPPTFLAR